MKLIASLLAAVAMSSGSDCGTRPGIHEVAAAVFAARQENAKENE